MNHRGSEMLKMAGKGMEVQVGVCIQLVKIDSAQSNLLGRFLGVGGLGLKRISKLLQLKITTIMKSEPSPKRAKPK